MTEKEIHRIIAENINRLLRSSNRTQLELGEYVGVTQATISNWCNGIKMPRMDKVDKICEFFGVKRSDLMEDHKLRTSSGIDDLEPYYIDEDVRMMAQELVDRPELKVLFSASRNVAKEDIEAVANILEKMKKD